MGVRTQIQKLATLFAVALLCVAAPLLRAEGAEKTPSPQVAALLARADELEKEQPTQALVSAEEGLALAVKVGDLPGQLEAQSSRGRLLERLQRGPEALAAWAAAPARHGYKRRAPAR